MKSIVIGVIVVLPMLAQPGNSLSAQRIREHDRFLASDLLEGRGVGERGGDLATEYIATQFALIGAKPAGDNGTYFQKVPLVGSLTTPDTKLSATKDAGARSLDFKWLDEFVGTTRMQRPAVDFDAEAIF